MKSLNKPKDFTKQYKKKYQLKNALIYLQKSYFSSAKLSLISISLIVIKSCQLLLK